MEDTQIDLTKLPIAVDVMGGDNGLHVVVEGAVRAAAHLGIHTILVGDESGIKSALNKVGAHDHSLVSIQHAPQEVTMDDSASTVLRSKRESSIHIAFELVKDRRAAGVVSPGNTGAVMAAGRSISGTLPGIGRPAIATLIPRIGGLSPVVLLDSGANVDCHASQLVQFALMGTYYAGAATDIRLPRVALLSNGSESSKGNDVTRSAALMLSQIENINFIGYVEGRNMMKDVADVVVCDGFLGNIVLKTIEGSVELVFDSIRDYVETSIRGKLGMWIAKPIFKTLFRRTLDPSSHGGAPLLGLRDLAIVCHGSSSSKAITNAIRVARKFVDEELVEAMSDALCSLDVIPEDDYEDVIWDRMGKRFDKKAKRQRAKGGSSSGAGVQIEASAVKKAQNATKK